MRLDSVAKAGTGPGNWPGHYRHWLSPRLESRLHFPAAENKQGYSLLAWNVLSTNKRTNIAHAVAADAQCDFILLLEINDIFWQQTIKDLNTSHKHRSVALRDDNFGIGFWSRYPFTGGIKQAGSIPYVDVKLSLPGGPVRFIGIHTVPPMNAGQTALSDTLLNEIYASIAPDEATIIAGDFNATVSNRWTQTLMREHNMFQVPAGLPLVHKTWAPEPIPCVLELDHIFVSPHIAIHQAGSGQRHGSDHRSLWMDWSKKRHRALSKLIHSSMRKAAR